MARKHYRPEEIIAKLREAEILLAQGMKVAGRETVNSRIDPSDLPRVLGPLLDLV